MKTGRTFQEKGTKWGRHCNVPGFGVWVKIDTQHRERSVWPGNCPGDKLHLWNAFSRIISVEWDFGLLASFMEWLSFQQLLSSTREVHANNLGWLKHLSQSIDLPVVQDSNCPSLSWGLEDGVIFGSCQVSLTGLWSLLQRLHFSTHTRTHDQGNLCPEGEAHGYVGEKEVWAQGLLKRRVISNRCL